MKENEKTIKTQLDKGCNLIKRKIESKATMTSLLKNASGLFGDTFWGYIDLSDEKYSKNNFDFAYFYNYKRTQNPKLYSYNTRWMNGEAFRELIDCEVLSQVVEKCKVSEKLKKELFKRKECIENVIATKPTKNKILHTPLSFLTDCIEEWLVRDIRKSCGLLKINVNFDNADNLSDDQQISLLPFLDVTSNVKANIAHSGNWAYFKDLNGNVYQNGDDFNKIEFVEEEKN